MSHLKMPVKMPALLLASFFLMPVAGVALPIQAMAQPSNPSPYQQPERILSVTGQGSQAIPTTLSEINLGVTVQAATAQAAQQQAAQQSTAVVEWLRSSLGGDSPSPNVDKIQTTGISLSPEYDYTNDRQELRGYRATNSIRFRTPTERAGALMDEAVNVGATQINGVSFLAEDEAINTARQQALTLAIQDAQQQADTVLGALGLSQQEVINISIGSVSAPYLEAAGGRLLSADTVISTPVMGQEQTINAQVTLSIRY